MSMTIQELKDALEGFDPTLEVKIEVGFGEEAQETLDAGSGFGEDDFDGALLELDEAEPGVKFGVFVLKGIYAP